MKALWQRARIKLSRYGRSGRFAPSANSLKIYLFFFINLSLIRNLFPCRGGRAETAALNLLRPCANWRPKKEELAPEKRRTETTENWRPIKVEQRLWKGFAVYFGSFIMEAKVFGIVLNIWNTMCEHLKQLVDGYFFALDCSCLISTMAVLLHNRVHSYLFITHIYKRILKKTLCWEWSMVLIWCLSMRTKWKKTSHRCRGRGWECEVCGEVE